MGSGEVMMVIGGQPTHIPEHNLVSLEDAKSAIRAFATGQRNALGLEWARR
jgi:hypothetical protein